jgi:hypothetical protein
MSGIEATLRRAKARLTEMTINEVSLVDKAANLCNFVVTKKDETMANAATQKMTLKIPAAAKQGLQDGLGQIIDKVTALAQIVGDAETDDTAAVPEELSTALNQIGQMATGMSSQYGGGAPATDAAAADGTGGPSEQAPPANASPDMGKNLDGTEKALPAPHKDAPMKTELHDGDSLSTIYRKAIAKANLEVAAFEAMEKAGRKMAGARYKKLSELHDNLGKLLNELAYDEAAETKGASEAEAEKAKKTPPPPPKKDDKAEPAAAAKADAPELAALQKELADLRAQLGTALAKNGENETKIAKLGTELTAVSKAHGVSNAGSVDGPASDAETKPNIWADASDMSAGLAKKRASANGAHK